MLVAIVIGLALFAFILGDMLGSGSPRMGGRKVAEIDGKVIDAQEYMNREQSLRAFYELNAGGQALDSEMERQIQQETWRRLLRETIMGRAYKKIGITVSTDELKSMVTGDQAMGLAGNPTLGEPHPIVRQMFSNPETGMLNFQVINSYFNALENPQFVQEKQRWLFIENEILDEKMSEKYFTLVQKGFQPSSLDIKDYISESQKSTDFSYVSRPFSEVADEEVNISEADLKAYYKEHIEKYRQNASRTFQYVVFEVKPSQTDIENAEFLSRQSRAEFARIEGDEIPRYVNQTSDEPFDVRFYTREELPVGITDSLKGADEGQIFGPYRDGESFKVSRAYNLQMRPDSVRARHILLSSQAFNGNRAAMKAVADSLVQVLEKGGSFHQIAMEYSADESNKAIGGDLGWFSEGTMVTNFNNACFENKKGDLLTADTQFGIHIIRIEDQSRPVEKMQVATVVKSIFPSDETNQDYYNRAVKFRGKATNLDNFTEQAREFGLDPRFAPNIGRDQQTIPGIEEPTRIIKWAYTSDINSVSDIFSQSDEQYIVAVLTEAREEGYASMEQVRTELELAVLKQKKAEKLVERMQGELAGVSDLNEWGTANKQQVGEATQVSFTSTFVPGIGMEPFIVGASTYLPVDQISVPMIGESGVFVIAVNNRTDNPSSQNEADLRTRLRYTFESRSSYEAYNALMEKADIEDRRLEIFYN